MGYSPWGRIELDTTEDITLLGHKLLFNYGKKPMCVEFFHTLLPEAVGWGCHFHFFKKLIN